MNIIEPLKYDQFPHVVTMDIDYSDQMYGKIKFWLSANIGSNEKTYIGPVYNHESFVSHYYFLNIDDATLFALTWHEPPKKRKFMIDPPSGWKWGFPREIPEEDLHRIHEWLVGNGYPKRELDQYKGQVPYRVWKA